MTEKNTPLCGYEYSDRWIQDVVDKSVLLDGKLEKGITWKCLFCSLERRTTIGDVCSGKAPSEKYERLIDGQIVKCINDKSNFKRFCEAFGGVFKKRID